MVLFNETIFYNIAYGRLDATEEEVYAAARQAAIHDQVGRFSKHSNKMVAVTGTPSSERERALHDETRRPLPWKSVPLACAVAGKLRPREAFLRSIVVPSLS